MSFASTPIARISSRPPSRTTAISAAPSVRWLWDRMHRATIDVARTVKPHAVMAVKGSYLDAQTIRIIKRELGVPFFNYYPDHPYCGVPLNPRKTSAQRRDLIDVLKEYTRVWTWEPALVGASARRTASRPGICPLASTTTSSGRTRRDRRRRAASAPGSPRRLRRPAQRQERGPSVGGP